MLGLIFKSFKFRWLTTLLTIVSISLSVTLIVGIERLRQNSRQAFISTVSGSDLLVGAKGSRLNLLLYSIFHIGSAIENIDYKYYLEVQANEQVDWSIPFSLGDSHRGFRVVGTDENFFKHYQYGASKKLSFKEGRSPRTNYELAIGAQVAKQLAYKLEDQITLQHGSGGGVSFQDHSEHLFKIVGILAPTATPVDKAVYAPLEAIEAIHQDWQESGERQLGQIQSISAFLLKAKTRLSTLYLQRDINEHNSKALMAILPGVVLSELWQNLSYMESALFVISVSVAIVSFLAMLISIYQSLRERRREMAILRSLGASPRHIFLLLGSEALLLSLMGLAFGFTLLQSLAYFGQSWIQSEFSLNLTLTTPSSDEWKFMLAILTAGCFLGLIPAWQAYRQTLSDGLSIKS